jgi:hypothetical protein
MNLLELRQKLHGMCEKEGGAVKLAKKLGLKSHSHISAVKRGDAKPGRELLRAIGMQKSFSPKKSAKMKFEDIS